MSKKRFGKFVALAAASGVVAAGISYFLKYKSFHDELDEDFHDFESTDDDFDGELPHEKEAPARTYVSLSGKETEEAPSQEAEASVAEPAEEKAAAPDASVEETVTEAEDTDLQVTEDSTIIEEDTSLS